VLVDSRNCFIEVVRFMVIVVMLGVMNCMVLKIVMFVVMELLGELM